jgi:hypothetical protein
MLWKFHLFFYVGAITAAAVLDRRQAPKGSVVGIGPDGKKQMFGYTFDLEKLAPPMRPLSKVDLQSRIRSNSVRKVTKYGPFTLAPVKVSTILSQFNLLKIEDAKFLKAGVKVEHSHGMMGAMGGSSKSSSSPKSMADLIPGAPAITPEHLSKASELALKGDYENAIGTILKIPQDGAGDVIMTSLKDGFCTNCTILAIKTDVVNEDGSRMDISNGVYLHHAVSINLGWRQVSNWLDPCPGGVGSKMKSPSTQGEFQTPFTIFGNAAVDEFLQWFGSPKEDSAQGGMYLSPQDFILLQAEMINYTQKEKKVYINFDYEYVPGRMGKETTTTITSVTGRH